MLQVCQLMAELADLENPEENVVGPGRRVQKTSGFRESAKSAKSATTLLADSGTKWTKLAGAGAVQSAAAQRFARPSGNGEDRTTLNLAGRAADFSNYFWPPREGREETSGGRVERFARER